MPIYDYECKECGSKIIDIYQSIHSEALTRCDSCGTNSLERIIFCPYVSVKGEPTTIGHLAERNSQKMGKSKVEDCTAKDKESKKKQMAEAKKEFNSKLGKMNENQKRRYIEDGKI